MVKLYFGDFKKAFSRFPIAMLSTCICWCIFTLGILDVIKETDTTDKAFLALGLIFFASTATNLLRESKEISNKSSNIIHIVYINLIILFIATATPLTFIIRYTALLSGLIIFNFIAPYIFKNNTTRHKLLTFAFAVIINVGKTIILPGVLLIVFMSTATGLVSGNLYWYIFSTVLFLLIPVLFLARVPTDFDKETSTN